MQVDGGSFFDRFRFDISPATENALKDYGDYKVHKFMIYRKPVQAVLLNIVNLISLGRFNRKLEYYDEIFHLYMIIELKKDGPLFQTIYLKTEKTPNIQFEKVSNYEDDAHRIVDFSTHIPFNLKELINTTRKNMGSDFIKYNALTNNCQIWILNLVKSASELCNVDFTRNVVDFIYQDVKDSLKGLSLKTVNFVTNLGGIFNRIITGKGLDADAYNSIRRNPHKYIHNPYELEKLFIW